MRNVLFVVLSALAVAACATAPERPPDDFVRAAESWEGLTTTAMIKRWGPPDVMDGESATWRLGHRSMRCIDSSRRQAPLGGFGSYTRLECAPIRNDSRCIVRASFDELQEITEVDAFSRRCAQYYAPYIRVLDSGYPYNLYKYGDGDDPRSNSSGSGEIR